MEYTVYERPREKLRSRGVRALSTSELLQIIIGSGTRTASSARIAKVVAGLLMQTEPVTFTQLIGVRGLGEAKVSQLLSALELGRRLENASSTPHTENGTFTTLATAAKRTIEFNTIRGDGVLITNDTVPAYGLQEAMAGARKVFAQALHDEAYTITIGLGCRNQNINTLDDTVLAIVKKIFETADLLEVNIPSVWLVNKNAKRAFRRKAVQ